MFMFMYIYIYVYIYICIYIHMYNVLTWYCRISKVGCKNAIKSALQSYQIAVLVADWLLRISPTAALSECCVCFEKNPVKDLYALVPCGHRCVCARHAADAVGRACPLCRKKATAVMRIYDSWLDVCLFIVVATPLTLPRI